jgi:hypothetical protein
VGVLFGNIEDGELARRYRQLWLIELDKDAARALYAVRTVSQSHRGDVSVEYVDINDARKNDDIKKDAGAWRKRSLDSLRNMHCRKVVVTPLGEVRCAND